MIKLFKKVPDGTGFGLDLSFDYGSHVYFSASEVEVLSKMLFSLFPEHFVKRVSDEDIQAIAKEALKK